MTVQEIQKKSDLPLEVAESIYWHVYWIRKADVNTKIDWQKLLFNKAYRLKGLEENESR